MTQKPIFNYTKGLYYKTWLTICALIIIATLASSFLVYIQVNNQLQTHMEQRLLWQANFYRQQLDEAFLQTALKLDNLVHSSAAVAVNKASLQEEMVRIHKLSPSLIRSWLAYPNGNLIPAPNTRPGYVNNLPWWHEYLSGKTPHGFMGLQVGQGQSLVGKPFIDGSNPTTLVPLLSFDLQGVQIRRAAGGQIDLNIVMTDNTGMGADWSDFPVSIYTTDGILVAYPHRDYFGNLKLLNKPSRHPLIRKMIAKPNELSEFDTYRDEASQKYRQMAGVYLKDPLLGLVLVVEYPASEIIDPVRRIAAGPLVIVALLLVIATVLIATLYTNNKRLRQVEQLARSAELRALQAHINPHFLFNTLDSLVGLAVATGNAAIVKMMRSLIHIFRYTTRNSGELVPLREELDYLREYVSLQQTRYGSRFTFELAAPEEILEAKIFKFCIQPLVENCFIHGVEKSLDPVMIRVAARHIDKDIEICVSDNGPGMTSARLEEINGSLEQETYESGSQGHGVGVSNIHHRLKYAYGNAYGIRLEPLQPGLAVHLRFPVERS